MVDLIRDFTRDDQDQVRALIQEGMRQRWGDDFDPRCNTDTDDLQESYVERGGEIVVFEADGDLVATGSLVPQGSNDGRILRMSVAGVRQGEGYGRRIVTELVERARRRGFVILHVETDTPWTDAVGFYADSGFTQVSRDEVSTHFEMVL